MAAGRNIDRDRAASGLLVLFLHLALGWLLVAGLGVRLPAVVESRLQLFDVPEPPPPPAPAPVPPRQAVEAPEGEAAPPNLRSRATQVVAPPPVVRLPVPPPIVAAPVANVGAQATQGASERPGPGTGAGGEGTGTGAGGAGDGGGSGTRARGARWIAGRIDGRDYPDHLYRAGIGGLVHMRFVVTAQGRVRDCRIVRSSGVPELDRITCRLVERRIRYSPARDAAGRPVAEVNDGHHIWEVGPEPPPVEYEADIPEE